MSRLSGALAWVGVLQVLHGLVKAPGEQEPWLASWLQGCMFLGWEDELDAVRNSVGVAGEVLSHRKAGAGHRGSTGQSTAFLDDILSWVGNSTSNLEADRRSPTMPLDRATSTPPPSGSAPSPCATAYFQRQVAAALHNGQGDAPSTGTATTASRAAIHALGPASGTRRSTQPCWFFFNANDLRAAPLRVCAASVNLDAAGAGTSAAVVPALPPPERLCRLPVTMRGRIRWAGRRAKRPRVLWQKPPQHHRKQFDQHPQQQTEVEVTELQQDRSQAKREPTPKRAHGMATDQPPHHMSAPSQRTAGDKRGVILLAVDGEQRSALVREQSLAAAVRESWFSGASPEASDEEPAAVKSSGDSELMGPTTPSECSECGQPAELWCPQCTDVATDVPRVLLCRSCCDSMHRFRLMRSHEPVQLHGQSSEALGSEVASDGSDSTTPDLPTGGGASHPASHRVVVDVGTT